MVVSILTAGSIDQVGGSVSTEPFTHIVVLEGNNIVVPPGIVLASQGRKVVWSVEPGQTGITLVPGTENDPLPQVDVDINTWTGGNILLRCTIAGQPLNFYFLRIDTIINNNLEFDKLYSAQKISWPQNKIVTLGLSLNNNPVSEGGTILQVSSGTTLSWTQPTNNDGITSYIVESYASGVWTEEYNDLPNAGVSVSPALAYRIIPVYANYSKPEHTYFVPAGVLNKSVIQFSNLYSDASSVPVNTPPYTQTFFTFNSTTPVESSTLFDGLFSEALDVPTSTPPYAGTFYTISSSESYESSTLFDSLFSEIEEQPPVTTPDYTENFFSEAQGI